MRFPLFLVRNFGMYEYYWLHFQQCLIQLTIYSSLIFAARFRGRYSYRQWFLAAVPLWRRLRRGARRAALVRWLPWIFDLWSLICSTCSKILIGVLTSAPRLLRWIICIRHFPRLQRTFVSFLLHLTNQYELVYSMSIQHHKTWTSN